MLLVTSNSHKKEEFQRLAPELSWQTLKEWGDEHQKDVQTDIEETGLSFVENAVIKARAGWSQTGVLCIADDSGLCVDALDGAPGIYSARYVEGTSKDRYMALLKNLEGIAHQDRTAAFHCALAICGLTLEQKSILNKLLPLAGLSWQDDCLIAQGLCPGWISLEPFGEGGFGYDPVFNLADGRSFASVSGQEKDKFSHRGNALRVLMQVSKIFS